MVFVPNNKCNYKTSIHILMLVGSEANWYIVHYTFYKAIPYKDASVWRWPYFNEERTKECISPGSHDGKAAPA